MTLRLVLADDHSVVLQGLEAILGMQPDFEVVELCTDGREAVQAVKTHRPDVLVTDAEMPGCTGLEAFRQLQADGADVPTVILAASLDNETLRAFLRASVSGIVLKDSAAADLVEAIRKVADGKRWIGPELTARALELSAEPADDPEDALTPREKEVAIHVASGLSNRRVASQLGIAESTVKLHLHKAFNKLQVSNRTQLSLLARDRGWID